MDYQLKPVGKTCAATGKELLPGSRCRSVLVAEAGSFKRHDYADEAWPGSPANAVAVWRFQIPQADESTRRKPLDADSLMACFEQMTDDANPASEKLRFVLALWLVQKRRLKIDGSRRDDEIKSLQLIGTRGEGPYEVREFELSEDERRQLQESVDELLTA
ncbi:MAG: hypothetical protein ACE5KM_07900 [Planctomycetaceae bacterium]